MEYVTAYVDNSGGHSNQHLKQRVKYIIHRQSAVSPTSILGSTVTNHCASSVPGPEHTHTHTHTHTHQCLFLISRRTSQKHGVRLKFSFHSFFPSSASPFFLFFFKTTSPLRRNREQSETPTALWGQPGSNYLT